MDGYFDFNATTPLFPAARQALLQALDEDWRNPSSLYHRAGAVRRHLQEARESIATRLGVSDPERLIFTSGATESNNIVFAHAAASAGQESRVVISAVEHPSVREPARRYFADRCLEAPVDSQGTIDPKRLRELAASPSVCLVSVMAAGNESGVLQPWREIASHCRDLGLPFHCDAAQWVGKLPSSGLTECDWVTGSAHKFGGPKGVGFLILPEGFEGPLLGAQGGGPQESGRRAGTENYPAIAAMGVALQEAESLLETVSSTPRDAFEKKLRAGIPGLRVVGEGAERLWNTSMFVVPEHGNLKWLIRLSHEGFEVSTGSACSAGRGNPSRSMEAMGLTFEEMGQVIRVSGGWQSSEEDWLTIADAVVETWQALSSGDSRDRRKRTISLGDATL